MRLLLCNLMDFKLDVHKVKLNLQITEIPLILHWRKFLTSIITFKSSTMPELPEIALLKKYVDSTSLNHKIVGLVFVQSSLLQAPKKDFEKLKGKKFSESQQLGKYLFLKADSELWLGFHFGMTGKLEYYKNQEPPKYTHLILKFSDASELAYVCRRKLGKIYLTPGVEDFQENHSIGKHALGLSLKEFQDLMKGKRGMIKASLTDQHNLAGIGNVYADEILFQCRIHPKTRTDSLTHKELKCVFNEMGKVLNTIIKIDGDRSELPSNYLVPRRKEGEPCPDCNGKVEKTTVSGRSTYFCPSCQKEK